MDADPAVAAAQRLAVAPPDRVGVAVSGGPDSLAALLLVAGTCGRKGVPVFALHVDHGLRPEAGARERALVESVARNAGAGFSSRSVDVRAARQRRGGSIEFVARTLRHEALGAMAAELGLTHVVLAHHRDDQVETVLLSLLRGAWPAALAGMPAERAMAGGARLVRPFLDVPRSALRAHGHAAHPMADPMNLDAAHRRVAVRERLLPTLREAEPAVDAIVLAVASRARSIDAAAAEAAARLLASPSVVAEPGVFMVRASAIAESGRFVAARLLKSACERDPALGHATWAMVRRLERAASVATPWSMQARRGLAIAARSGFVALFATPEPWAIGAEVTWDGEAAAAPIDAVRTLRVLPLAHAVGEGAVAMECHLPPGARVSVRARRPGDRFRLGPQGSKPVADELADRKVHPAWRRRIPLVFVDGVLRWIPGLRAVRIPGEPAPDARLVVEGPVPWRDEAGYRKATT